MKAMTVGAGAVSRCPDSSLLASHWRADGTCAHEPPSLTLLVQEAKRQRLGLEIDAYPGSETGLIHPRVTLTFYTVKGLPYRTAKTVTAVTIETATKRAWRWLQGRRR